MEIVAMDMKVPVIIIKLLYYTKSVNHEQYDPMVFWVDSIGKLSNIPFIVNKKYSFFESLKSMICATCLFYYNMFVFSEDYFFPNFLVNIWVASFVACAFRGSTILQSGI